ncbi:MAG: TetR/AcrR family transcriptional regulator [Chloroflexi bacterium]|nr:MAG: TetR/AcrR family transcriptional regulator [Chloroflexota bacterium]
MKSSLEQADLRVRRTHRLLWEALMAELSERAFEQITVKDICERAMVHRTTFYKHYEDKFALLEQGMRQMYDDMVAAEEHAPPSTFSIEHPPPYFIHLFEHVAHHQQFYKLMLCGEGIGRFQKLVKDYIVEVAAAKMRELTPDSEHLAVPLAMHVQCVAGAVLSLLAWWLENDMPFSPYHMAQYLLKISGHSTLLHI